MAVSSTPRARKPRTAQAFTRKLLAWYRRAARDLPWRRTRDPYRVLVSEFMLQQTQVSRVAEFYPRFLERFPDLGTLARAPARQVREAWDGLGYYARASNLHALARVVKDGKRAWKFNQAIMELGAVICVARKPKCPECPVRPACRTGKVRLS